MLVQMLTPTTSQRSVSARGEQPRWGSTNDAGASMPSKNIPDDVCLLNSGRIHSLCWDDIVLAGMSGEHVMQLPAVAAASANFKRDDFNKSTSYPNNNSSRGNTGKAVGVYGLETGVDNPGPMPSMHPFASSASYSSGMAKTSATIKNLEPLPEFASQLFSDISRKSAQPGPVQTSANEAGGGGSRGAWSVKIKNTTSSSAASSQQRQQSFDPEQVTDYIIPYLQDEQKPNVVSAGHDADVLSSGAIVGDRAGGWPTSHGAGRRFSPGTGGGRPRTSTSRRVCTETSQRALHSDVGSVAVGAPQSPKPMTAATGCSTASRADIAPTVDGHGIKAPSTISPARVSPSPAISVGGGEHARKHSFDTLAKMIPNLNELGNNKKAGWLKTPPPKTSQPAERSYAATGVASPALPQNTSSLFPAQHSTSDSPTTTAQNMSANNTPSGNDFWGGGGAARESTLPTHRQEVLARYRRKKNTRNDVAEAEERERGQRRCADEEQSWMRPRKNGRFCSEGTRFVSITSIQPPGDGRRTISCEIAAAFARSAV